MENGSQKAPISSWCGVLFRTFFATLSFMCRFSPRPPILGAIWLTLGSLWPPFGSLLAPAGSLLAPFWLPLGPFWFTFRVPWLTFGALSFTFGHSEINLLTFAVSCPHFSYLFEFSMKISCKIWFLNHFLWKPYSRSIKSYFPEAHRTHPNRKYIFSCNPPFKGPERNICRRQLRLIDPHRACRHISACELRGRDFCSCVCL